MSANQAASEALPRRLYGKVAEVSHTLSAYPALAYQPTALPTAEQCFAQLGRHLAEMADLNRELRVLEPIASDVFGLVSTVTAIDLSLAFLRELACVLQAELDCVRSEAA